MKRILVGLLLVLAPYVYGEVTFSHLDLSPANTLLFESTTSAPGYGTYSTLFAADLTHKSIQQLSFFPEEMMLVGNHELQIENRYGVFRTDAQLQNMAPVASFPSFVHGADIATGKISASSASPDGNYLLSLKPVDFGHADLVLYSIKDGTSVTISKGVERTLKGPRALWSPDSSFFVYSKGGQLYYFSIDQLNQQRVIDENFRTIGDGTIANMQWGNDGNLYYVNGSLVYRIAPSDLFMRSLYTQLLSVGSIVGKIPFAFDPNFDRFWISPDGTSILLDKEGRNVILFVLQGDDYLTTGNTKTLPYLYLPRNTSVSEVLWSTDGIITLLTSSVVGNGTKTSVFRLNMFAAGVPLFQDTGEQNISELVLSDDGTKALVLKPTGVSVRDYHTWRDLQTIAMPNPIHALWLSGTEAIIAGAQYTDDVNVTDGSSHLISISQPTQYGFGTSNGRIEVSAGSRVEELVSAGDPSPAAKDSAASSGPGASPTSSRVSSSVNWTPIPAFSVAQPSNATDQYRVYVDTAQSSIYTNIVMIRSLGGSGTLPLFSYPQTKYEAFPAKDEPVDFNNFSHGSRIRRREVSLVFNAIDSVDGLTTVLNTLQEYGIKATFFVNGEFMRRNPEAVQEIADSGQEVGSLFFAYFDLTDARFRPDASFIKQGLGRNEDEYYALTGKELSLLWHAPYYFTNSDIIEAAAQLNYTYVGRDVDPLDWVTQSDALRGANIYLSTADIVNRIMQQKKPGSIIPIRIGKTDGERDDYLWNSLDVLINDLMTLGYSIVPVSTLMEHAR